MSTWACRVVLIAHATLLIGLPVAAGRPGVLLAVPLLFPLPGLWRGTSYTYAWCSLLLSFYLGGLLMEAVTGGSWYATVLASAAAIEFCALLLYVRFKSLERRAGAA
ncbi:MAG: DUF2069 domain-containing protein [Hydrocarboniphaga effusa]|nr:DUF2069 domain-containing protein [Hydrocarboniphaga effusa]